MDYKKTIQMLVFLTAFTIYANAQVETNIEQTIHYTPETHFKNTMELADKGFGNSTEVPEFEPEVIDESDEIQLYWSVYPNPTNNSLILWVKNLDSLKTEVHLSYRLYDVNGNLLINEHVLDEKTGVDVEFLSPSVYYLSVLTEKSIKSFKIIKF